MAIVKFIPIQASWIFGNRKRSVDVMPQLWEEMLIVSVIPDLIGNPEIFNTDTGFPLSAVAPGAMADKSLKAMVGKPEYWIPVYTGMTEKLRTWIPDSADGSGMTSMRNRSAVLANGRYKRN